jgi:hypothetical protein
MRESVETIAATLAMPAGSGCTARDHFRVKKT